MQIPITDVPLEVRRAAAQHLESVHGTELMSGAEGAYLDTYAVPIYRPDIQEIAYYEFRILKARSSVQLLLTRDYLSSLESARTGKLIKPRSFEKGAAESADKQAIGFIVASNGRHDFPVAHWSLNRLPPSQQVLTDPRQSSQPEEANMKGKRLYRLDSLAYAAENESGDLVGQSGQLPSLLAGLPHSLDRYAGQIASAIALPLHGQPEDSDADNARHEIKQSEHEAPPLKRDDEGGWRTFKERYAEAFGPFLDHLRQRAAKTWELADLIRENGEGIVAGTTHRVALLGEASIELSGEGAQYIEPTIQAKPAGPPSLVLRAQPVPLQQELDLAIVVRYSNGEQETLRFFILSRHVPSNVKAERSNQNRSDCEE